MAEFWFGYEITSRKPLDGLTEISLKRPRSLSNPNKIYVTLVKKIDMEKLIPAWHEGLRMF